MKTFDNKKIGLYEEELQLLKSLDTSEKIQDFVSAIPQNFEPDGDSCMSVREVLAHRRAHCIEGALVAALAFWVNGERPLLMDMTATEDDYDHVITLFKHEGHWGAISKGNHAYVRYRDPVYRTLRELTMSYFNEYYNTNGIKTLRLFSLPVDLRKYAPKVWITGNGSWKIAEDLDKVKHFTLLTKGQEKLLRPIDALEQKAAQIAMHKP